MIVEILLSALCKNYNSTYHEFKGGPSDFGTKILQKCLKNHPYTPKVI